MSPSVWYHGPAFLSTCRYLNKANQRPMQFGRNKNRIISDEVQGDVTVFWLRALKGLNSLYHISFSNLHIQDIYDGFGGEAEATYSILFGLNKACWHIEYAIYSKD